LVTAVTTEAAAGIRKRHQDVVEKRKHADHNVQAGRDYVAAYVEYVHYVERVHQSVAGAHEPHAAESTAPAPCPASRR